MTKIMESDMWQVICLENSGEVCSHEARLDDFTNLIDIDVCFAFLGEAIHLHVQVIQEKAFHAILGKQFLHDQPVFLIQSLLIVIRHQHIVADQVRQTQLNAGGVDTLEDFLGILALCAHSQ